MAIYLKKFETQAAYEAAQPNLILPNVSLTVDNNTAHYSPYDPYNGHDYVEIGGFKWATMNVGANSVTDTGLYFQWGDTQGYTASQVGSGEGQKYFGWEDYKYWTGDTGSGSSGMTKYNSSDGKTVLAASDDAARANWGGSWRMPTTIDFYKLSTAVNTAITNDYQSSGVKGLVCTDKTDSSKVLFFPFALYADKGSIGSSGGYYWSSKLDSSYIAAAFRVLNASNVNWGNYYNNRYYGYTIRPILDE